MAQTSLSIWAAGSFLFSSREVYLLSMPPSRTSRLPFRPSDSEPSACTERDDALGNDLRVDGAAVRFTYLLNLTLQEILLELLARFRD